MSVGDWTDLLRQFQDAAEIHRRTGAVLRIFTAWREDEPLPFFASAGLLLQTRMELPRLWFSDRAKGGKRTQLRPFIIAETEGACAKFEELAGVGGRLCLAALAAQRGAAVDLPLATAWAFQLYERHRNSANAFHRALANGSAIDDPFTASVRSIEAMLAKAKPTTPQPVTRPKRSTSGGKMTQSEANPIVWRLLQESPDLTIRELVERIGCSQGLIAKTPAWKQAAADRKQAKRPVKPKAVNLSDGLQKVTPSFAEADPLAELIAEQERDSEPSPYGSARRKTRVRKSV